MLVTMLGLSAGGSFVTPTNPVGYTERRDVGLTGDVEDETDRVPDLAD
jgi:hypothetical protein